MSAPFIILAMLVPLVVIHELGHFIMAKLGGIHVTRFAFGFGKKLFGFHYKGTEYRWNLLPLGGYVDLMGELIYTNRIPENAAHFYNKPKWIRFLVLLMGPMFNLILAFGLYWFIFAVRGPEIPIFLGDPYTVGMVEPGSAEMQAGLEVGDRITRINGEEVTSVDQVDETILLSPNQEVRLEVLRGGQQHAVTYRIPEDPIEGIGEQRFRPKRGVRIDGVEEDMPAKEAGLKVGDLITHVNYCDINLWYRTSRIPYLIAENAPDPSVFTVVRGDKTLEIEVVPVEAGEDYWLTGINLDYVDRPEADWIEALGYAWKSCERGSTLIYKGLKNLIMQKLSIKTLSSPIEIGNYAVKAYKMGTWTFLGLMAMLSLNLGLMNLLPIPVLDGGEIFVLAVEWITGRDFDLETKMKIKMVGLFFLVGLMAIVLTSDVIKLFRRM